MAFGLRHGDTPNRGARRLDARVAPALDRRMPIPRFSSSATGADVAAGLAAEGCAIVERVVPQSVLEQAERVSKFR